MALFMQPALKSCKHSSKLRLQNGLGTEFLCLKCRINLKSGNLYFICMRFLLGLQEMNLNCGIILKVY